MTILKDFLHEPKIVADPEKLKNFCEFIENSSPLDIDQKDIGSLHVILKNLHRIFFKESFYYDFSPKHYVESLISEYKNKVKQHRSYSCYFNNKSYNYNDIQNIAVLIKEGYHFEFLQEEISKTEFSDNLNILNKFIITLKENRDEYVKIIKKASGLFDNPFQTIEHIYTIAQKENESFKKHDIFKNIPEFFQDAEKIYGFTDHEQKNRSHDGMMKYLRELTWKQETEIKKKIIISYIKTYALSLQTSLIAKMKYQHLCNSCYIKTLSLNFDDRECLIEKSIKENEKFIKSLKHKRYDPVKDKAEHIAMLKDGQQSIRDRVTNFNKNNIDVLCMLNNKKPDDCLVMTIKKKGLGLAGSFNKNYDTTFMFKKLGDEHYSLILSNGLHCSFLNKEKFLSEIEMEHAKKTLFPNVKEPFVIKIEV